MTKVAVLGLGAMGSRMAMKLVEAGHEVTVWNRTPDRAAALVAAGAVAAATPRAAVAEADIAIAMVRDDAASRAVWLDPATGALDHMKAGAVAIESSTLSLDGVHMLARAAAAASVDFLDAPVAGSRPQAEAGQLIYFVGGEAEVLERVRPVLAPMGLAVHHAGGVGAGAALKLAVNALFGVQVAVLAELIGLLRRNGADLPRAVEILGLTPVASPAAKGAMAAMLAGRHAPMFPVELVEKDLGYAVAATSEAPISAAARAVFAAAMGCHLGLENLTAAARLYE
jgi:3-hydroxyisobutyrate dehydrogenase